MPHAARSRYHHGDARNALLAAADRLLERVGVQGLSLRQVAQEAQLSHQAPYNHFENKQSLLAELARRGFVRLEAQVRQVRGYPAASRALQRAGEVYIRFAQQSPALFRLMFAREIVDVNRYPAASAAGRDAYGSLVAIVAALAPARRVDELSLAAWCFVHGYATLCIETRIEDSTLATRRAAQFARLIRQDAQGSVRTEGSRAKKR